MAKKYKNTLIVVDGNWLINRAHSVYATHRNPAESTAKQVIAWMFEYALVHQASHMLLAIDGDNVFRKIIFPGYKLSRQKKREAEARDSGNFVEGVSNSNPVYECLSSLFERADKLKVPYIQEDAFEADDILVGCANKFSGPDCKVVLICNDKDDIQGLINEHVVLWTPAMMKKEPVYVTCSSIEALGHKFKDSQQFLHYQILIGDPMDDVPQLMTPAKAYKVVSTYGSLGGWFKTPEGREWFMKHSGPVKLNRELITMVNQSVDKLTLSKLKPEQVAGYEDIKPKNYYNYFGLAKTARRSLFG